MVGLCALLSYTDRRRLLIFPSRRRHYFRARSVDQCHERAVTGTLAFHMLLGGSVPAICLVAPYLDCSLRWSVFNVGDACSGDRNVTVAMRKV